MLQALAGAELLTEVEPQHRDPAGGIIATQGLHEGQVVQGAEVPQAPPAVRRHFYSTVIVGGTAKWWWFAATWWLTARAGLIHLERRKRRKKTVCPQKQFFSAEQKWSSSSHGTENSESLSVLSSPGLIVNNECFLGWGEEVGVHHRLQTVLVCLWIRNGQDERLLEPEPECQSDHHKMWSRFQKLRCECGGCLNI